MSNTPAFTVQDVIEAAVSDPASYYKGALLEAAMKYEFGNGDSQLIIAAKYIEKLAELEKSKAVT